MAADFEFALRSKQALAAINLKRKTEYNCYKPAQLRCLKSVIKTDTLGVLPTGYGKSLIFEALPFIQSSVVLIVTPLNSIITEQISRYGKDCIRLNEEFVNSDSGNVNVRYVVGHPEDYLTRTAFRFFRSSQWQSKVTQIVVDEAHCVSQWGNDFREKFRDIVKLRSLFPAAKVLALTATATLRMQKEISDLLGMKDVMVISTNMDRMNIKIEVRVRPPCCGGKTNVEHSYDYVYNPIIDELCEKGEQFPKTVVYTKLKWCGYGFEKGYRKCKGEQIKLIAQYHSPCTSEMRREVVSHMADPNGPTKLLFATEAYSMGTDAPDIRRIIHAGVPTRLETYVQEIGRAGRDGSPATATMYYNNSDISTCAKGMTEEMREFCTLQTCRREYLCQHFGFPSGMSEFTFKHECCDICEKGCTCETCTDHQLASCLEESNPPSAKVNKLSPTKKEQLELVLMEYFAAENGILNVPNPELTTGLSYLLAKEICADYLMYQKKEHILCKHKTVSPHIAENIALIVCEMCLN